MLNMACAAFYFFPNSQIQESRFFLKFARDVYIPTLANLLTKYVKVLRWHIYITFSGNNNRSIYIGSHELDKDRGQKTQHIHKENSKFKVGEYC